MRWHSEPSYPYQTGAGTAPAYPRTRANPHGATAALRLARVPTARLGSSVGTRLGNACVLSARSPFPARGQGRGAGCVGVLCPWRPRWCGFWQAARPPPSRGKTEGATRHAYDGLVDG
jgi:hypothetical protein